MIHVHLAIPDDVGIQGMTLFSMATAGLRLRVSWYSGLPFAFLGRPLQTGFTYLTVFVANPADRSRGREVEFLVDSGCFYTMVPRTILEEIGVDPVMEQTFTLANGDEIRRQVGLVYLFYKRSTRWQLGHLRRGRRSDSIGRPGARVHGIQTRSS